MNTLAQIRSSRLPKNVSRTLMFWIGRLMGYSQEKLSYLCRFSITGSVCPSSRYFGERAAVEVASMSASFDRVVIAGIGSGVVASRIYERCPDAVFVECEDAFADRFRQSHPHAIVIGDRIEGLYEHLPALRGQRILLASFVPTAGRFHSDDMVRLFVDICDGGGLIMQMRYLPYQMSAHFFDGIKARGVISARLFTVLRNLPPVSMYGLRQQ